MAETQSGVAVVWGAGDLTFTGASIDSSEGKMQDYTFERNHSEAMLKDGVGDVVGMASYNRKATLNLTILPAHATARSGAAASAQKYSENLMIKPGTLVTVVDATNGSVIDTINSGKYQCITSRIRRTNTGPALIEVTLETFGDNDVTGAIS